VEVDSQIHKVLNLGVDLNPGAGPGPTPLQEGVASARLSMLGPISMAYAILSFYHARGLVQGLGGGHGKPWDASLPEDAARREAKNGFNKKAWAQKERTILEHHLPGTAGAGGSTFPQDLGPLMRGR
jgi:hypothetical protein